MITIIGLFGGAITLGIIAGALGFQPWVGGLAGFIWGLIFLNFIRPRIKR